MQTRNLWIRFGGSKSHRLLHFFEFVGWIGCVIMVVKATIGVLFVTGVFSSILFTAAGRVDWMEAWLLIGLYAVSLAGMMLWGAIHAPDLMKERSRMSKNIKAWDKVLNKFFTLMFVATLVVAGLDAGRFGWSSMPTILKWFGGLGCVAAGYIVWVTIKENAFLSRWARIQNERGQKVVSSGPYRYVRHPMYAAIIMFVLSTPLVLGSWWAALPACTAVVLYIIRTKKEDHMLHQELEGYEAYASLVRYRLIPGIW